MSEILFSLDEELMRFFHTRLKFKNFVSNGHQQSLFGGVDQLISEKYECTSESELKKTADQLCSQPTLYGFGVHTPNGVLKDLACITELNPQSVVVIHGARLFLGTHPQMENVLAYPNIQQVFSGLNSKFHVPTLFGESIIFYPEELRDDFQKFCQSREAEVTSGAMDGGYEVMHQQLLEKDISLKEKEREIDIKEDTINDKERQNLRLHNYVFSLVNDLKLAKLDTTVPFSGFGMDTLVTIVVPTFNQEAFIEDCLNSIANQSYREIEVVIQDGLSTDGTPAICEAFVKKDPRFRYYREEDTGQSDAINMGLEKSRGYFWSWICSDDRYSSNHCIEDLVVHYKQHSLKCKGPAIGVFGNAQYIKESGEVMHPYHQIQRDVNISDFQENWPFSQPASLLVRRRVHEVYGVRADLHLGMDLDLFLKMLSEDQIFLYCDTLVADVRIQDDSKSVKYRQKTAENALSIVNKYFGSIGNVETSMYAQELISATSKESAERFFVTLDVGIQKYFKLGRAVVKAKVKRLAPRPVKTAAKWLLNRP